MSCRPSRVTDRPVRHGEIHPFSTDAVCHDRTMKPTAPIVLAGFVLDIVLNLAACGTAPSDGVHRVPVTSTDQPAIVHVRACTATATCGDGSQQSAPLHACPVAGSISLDVEDDACSAACEGRDGWVDLCEIADCHDTDEECDPS